MTDKDTARLAEIESIMRARIAEHLFHMEPLKAEKRAILNRARQQRFRQARNTSP